MRKIIDELNSNSLTKLRDLLVERRYDGFSYGLCLSNYIKEVETIAPSISALFTIIAGVNSPISPVIAASIKTYAPTGEELYSDPIELRATYRDSKTSITETSPIHLSFEARKEWGAPYPLPRDFDTHSNNSVVLEVKPKQVVLSVADQVDFYRLAIEKHLSEGNITMASIIGAYYNELRYRL